MPPEFIELIKTYFIPLLTGGGGLIFGRAWRQAKLDSLHQQNKNLEFERLNKTMDELQQENRDYRKEVRDLRTEMQANREQQSREMHAMREQHAAEMRAMREQHALERDGYIQRINQLETEVRELRTAQKG